jgi:hypothetical protein
MLVYIHTDTACTRAHEPGLQTLSGAGFRVGAQPSVWAVYRIYVKKTAPPPPPYCMANETCLTDLTHFKRNCSFINMYVLIRTHIYWRPLMMTRPRGAIGAPYLRDRGGAALGGGPRRGPVTAVWSVAPAAPRRAARGAAHRKSATARAQ